MTLISDGEMAALREVAESGMSGVATILLRSVVVTDDGQESVWATGPDVICWLHQETGVAQTLGNVAGAVGISQPFSIRVPIGTEVGSGDQVAVGSSLYVVESTNAESTYSAWLVLSCRVLE